MAALEKGSNMYKIRAAYLLMKERGCLLHLPLIPIHSIVPILHLVNDMLHLLALLLPCARVHFQLLVKELRVRPSVAAAQPVPQGSVLSVIVVEVEMVDRMTGSRVDECIIRQVLSIVNQNGPDIDKDKKPDIGELLQREEKDKEVVGNGLGESI